MKPHAKKTVEQVLPMQSWLRCFRAWISLKSYFNFGKIVCNRHAVSRTTIRASRRAAQLVASSEQRKTHSQVSVSIIV